ncbi:MAG: glyoxalase [Cyanobacteria bacterium QS_7_48_42]|jgi:predicted enzyme related to lactoylglutathione lyase|nr:MAG: glyoxalase [Cyanobacteria bacterium QS_4_48_99]PSO84551.1 MAG: glyoxalase [Cyanobacteria bacterium QS_5_48_63]PSO86652.1 MAG: glyoxalase [Cyanobacteria bacterium QH_9_48_43]PSO89408.1 MAG: glyoxalase [Cyanobacteria bacterium QS_3_48_167]PSO90525.1 MAG: glyoxalase [Cyanobacteria bacterium QS_9_48_30]PSO92218.1 MAG: glyoxalase [Cyanobacteria bacterium QS_6_48_18]PSO94694.1 MAG: glyoxalase [Cyanobacteria bacterium SW_6_48_11]PSP01118.1 MAG: glyoxalase [Cyanobacteria bacterium SW_7_48_12
MKLRYHDAFVALAAVDAEALIQFYRQLLEKEPQPYIPQVYAEFQLVGLRLGIFQPRDSHQQVFAYPAGSGMSLCLEVDNLEEAIALFNSLGYPPPGEITTASHGREIYAYDAAGNRIILHQSG